MNNNTELTIEIWDNKVFWLETRNPSYIEFAKEHGTLHNRIGNIHVYDIPNFLELFADTYGLEHESLKRRLGGPAIEPVETPKLRKPKKVLSPAHLAALKAGREKARKAKQG